MAIQTSNKADESTVKEFKQYTGVIPYRVVAINPTLDGLKKIGVEYLVNEPVYTSSAEFDGKVIKNTIVDFWVKSIPNLDFPDMEIILPHRFRINHEVFVGSNSGKTQFINKYGRTAWAMQASDLAANPYYVDEGSRPAHNGEEDMHKFIFSWLNMTYDTKGKKYDECLIDVNKLVVGNFSELQGLLPKFSVNKVKLLTGVNPVEKDGKIRYYQTTYNQMALKHNQTSYNRLQEYVDKDEYTAFSTDKRPVYYTYEIAEFNSMVVPDKDPEPIVDVPQDVF